MATRNLARTVVEGGRAGQSKYERRRLARVARRRWLFDADGEPYQRKRPLYYREFADRLGPLRRWLESRTGRRWDRVYSEFCRRYDRRTTKGWHLWTHLRDSVCCTGLEKSDPRYFHRAGHRELCAAGGTLRHNRWPAHRPRSAKGSPVSSGDAHEWAGSRRVIVRGKTLFWTAGIVTPAPVDSAKPWLLDRRPEMAQGRAFDESETAFWLQLSSKLRVELTYQPRQAE